MSELEPLAVEEELEEGSVEEVLDSGSEAEVSGEDDDDDDEEEEEEEDEYDDEEEEEVDLGGEDTDGEEEEGESSREEEEEERGPRGAKRGAGLALGKRIEPERGGKSGAGYASAARGKGKRRKLPTRTDDTPETSDAEEEEEEEEEETSALESVTSTDPTRVALQFAAYLKDNGFPTSHTSVSFYPSRPEDDGERPQTFVVPECTTVGEEVQIMEMQNLVPIARFNIHAVTANAFCKRAAFKPAFVHCSATRDDDEYHYLIVIE